MSKIIFSILLSVCMAFPVPVDRIQTVDGVIVDGDATEYTFIEIEDGSGWVIERDDSLRVGERVSITFDNMGTSEIYDDELVAINKI